MFNINKDKIMSIYEEHLRKESFKNSIERYQGKEKWFGASSAGSCYRKQAYKNMKAEAEAPDAKSLFRMRLGEMVHVDIQQALAKYHHDSLLIFESEIRLPELHVRGFLDIAEIENNTLTIADLKTIAAFAWQKKFGLKKNRATIQSTKYEKQIGTYAEGQRRKCAKLGIEIKGDPNLRLIYYKKDDSSFREVDVSPKYIEKALEYWREVNRLVNPGGDVDAEPLWDNMVPGEDLGCPFESWECNFCAYKKGCPSPFKKEGT
jgi:hypothetical protein